MPSEVLSYARYGSKTVKTASVPDAHLDFSFVERLKQQRLEKNAGVGSAIFNAAAKGGEFLAKNDKAIGHIAKSVLGKAAIPAIILGAMGIKEAIAKIRNEPKRKQIFESIASDPEFKDVDKGQLLEWYATLYHYAPTTTLDRLATKSILRQFKTFGNVDLQTLKSLADLERTQTSTRNDRNQLVSWAIH